jgi:hypothetical protein
LAAILVSAASAQAATFTFSFTNEPPAGTVNGTVTGRIDGLAATGTSAATAVFVTSSPAGVFYPLSASDNILAQQNLTVFSNTFTVTGGVLTSMDFRAGFTQPNGDAFSLALELFAPITQFNLRAVIAGPPILDRSVVASRASFEPVSQVPLPAALPLFATGLGALGLLGWRRKRKAKEV